VGPPQEASSQVRTVSRLKHQKQYFQQSSIGPDTSEKLYNYFLLRILWFVVDLQAARGVDTDFGSHLLQAVLLERSEKAEKLELLDGRSM
jgi:hypothetical protein